MQCCLNIHKFNKCNLAHIEAQGKKNNKNFTMCEKQNETKTTVVVQIKLTIYTALKNPAKPWRIFSVSFHFVLILNWPRKFQSRACCAYFVQVNPTPCPSHPGDPRLTRQGESQQSLSSWAHLSVQGQERGMRTKQGEMSLLQHWCSLTTQSARLVTPLPLGAERTHLALIGVAPLSQGGTCDRCSCGDDCYRGP